jgi:imidazole glycerol-phosphate synthase subunit HisF
MIHKRLVGVITVRQGIAVQSFGYRRHLPIGRPEVLAQNLCRWGVDEILVVCTDRSRHGLGPDLALLERFSRIGLATPLIYQGGIRSVADGVAAVQAGAERIAVDSLLRDDPRTAAALAEPLGAQALIAALPLSLGAEADAPLAWLDHRNGRSTPLPAETTAALRSGAFSELLVVDWLHEGTPGSFDERLIERAARQHLPLIAFGGLGEPAQLRRVLGHDAVVAAAVGNSLSWREHAVQALKTQLLGLPLRPPTYAQPAWA